MKATKRFHMITSTLQGFILRFVRSSPGKVTQKRRPAYTLVVSP